MGHGLFVGLFQTVGSLFCVLTVYWLGPDGFPTVQAKVLLTFPRDAFLLFRFDNPAQDRDRPGLAHVPLWIHTHQLISFEKKRLRLDLCLGGDRLPKATDLHAPGRLAVLSSAHVSFYLMEARLSLAQFGHMGHIRKQDVEIKRCTRTNWIKHL